MPAMSHGQECSIDFNFRSKPLKNNAVLQSSLGPDVASSKEEFLRQSRISLLYSAAIEGKDRQKEHVRAVGVQENPR